MTIPSGMTAEKLRDVADWLDTCDKVLLAYISLVREFLPNVRTEGIQAMIADIEGKGVQEDLRRWADEIDWQSVSDYDEDTIT